MTVNATTMLPVASDTKIKNTLFRFVALRKPEQIDENRKYNLFVHFPETLQSFSQLYSITKEELDTKLDTFIPKTKDQLRDINQALYDFSFWVIRNRSSITLDSYQQKMQELDINANDVLSESDEAIAWDNFIYQIVKQADNQAREAAMLLLYGNYLLKQINSTTSGSFTSGNTTTTPPLTNKQLRRILQARIVRPNFIDFPVVATSTSSARIANKPMSIATQQQFRAALQKVESKQTIQLLESLKEELNSAAKKYQKLEIQNKEAYDVQFKELQESYQELVNARIKDLLVDSEENIVFDNTAPKYNYIAINELDKERLQLHLSEDTYVLFNEITNDDIETFVQLIDLIDNKIAKLTNSQVSYRQLSQSFVSLNGVILPVIDESPTTFMDDYSYSIEPRKRGIRKYSLNLGIKFPSPSFKIHSVSYKTTQNNEIISTSDFADFTIEDNGITTGILFPGFQLEIPIATQQQNILLEAEIYTTTGNVYKLEKSFKVTDKVVYGTLVTNIIGSTSGSESGDEGTNEDNGSQPSTNKKYGVTRLGIADYRKVEQSVCCYVPGEVSHIENVMAREYKERATKRLRRSETTVTTEKSTETENLTDSTSTERNEMNQEIAKMKQESKDFNISANAYYKGAKWGVDMNTSFALHNSKEESNNMSKTEARELTERAMERVVTKVREERINKIIDEFTEENKHGFDNRKGDKHVSGVYRWIDKVYKNEIFNYGKRLMYEFMIPEPATFHKLFTNPTYKFDLEKPLDPRKITPISEALINSSKVSETNYQFWASAYNADVNAPPSEKLIVGKSYAATNTVNDGAGSFQKEWNDLKVTDGYTVTQFDCVHELRRNYPKDNKESACHPNGNIQIGPYNRVFVKKDNGFGYSFGYESNNQSYKIESINFNPNGETIPVSVICWDVSSFTLNVNANLKRTPELFQQWQNETFNKIIQAYEDKLALYEQSLAAFKAEQVESRKTNPLFFRDVENTVLRKNCIEYILGQNVIGKNFQLPITGISMSTHHINQSQQMENYAALAKFIE